MFAHGQECLAWFCVLDRQLTDTGNSNYRHLYSMKCLSFRGYSGGSGVLGTFFPLLFPPVLQLSFQVGT